MASWIQNRILLELTRHATRRYSQLRPRDVEGNLFLYYLHRLMHEGLVEKENHIYRLSAKGKQYASTLSLETGRTRRQPKIVTAIDCVNAAGEQLLIRWHRQPNVGLISLPYGMVHFGETITSMASIELAEKAGLSAELEYRGDIYIRQQRGDAVEAHMLVHLFSAANPSPDRESELRPDVCEYFWGRVTTLTAEAFVPGFHELIMLARDSHMPIASDILVDANVTRPGAVA